MAKKKRKYIRYSPEEDTVVYFYVKGRDSTKKIHAIGLVTTEAKGGFSCVMLSGTAPDKDDICLTKVGVLALLKSECVWKEKLADDIVRVGFKYLE